MIEKSKSNRGQTIVEFAFIMVLLFIFIMGILEFSIILYDKAILTDACREGAREGVLYRVDGSFDYQNFSTQAIKDAITNHLHNRLVTFGPAFNPDDDITVFWDPAPTHGAELHVQVDFPYTYLALSRFASAVGSSMGDGTLNISARSIMRME
jgi:hypothetical protein